MVALAVKVDEYAAKEDDDVRESRQSSTRKGDAPGGNSSKRATPMPSSLCDSGSKAGGMEQHNLASLGRLTLTQALHENIRDLARRALQIEPGNP